MDCQYKKVSSLKMATKPQQRLIKWQAMPVPWLLKPKYMLVAGAVAGGGLTVIANAPNPAGIALLKRGFADETIGAGGLLLGALGPTAVAAVAFLVL